MLVLYPEYMSDGPPISYMVQKNSVVTGSDLVAQTKPKKGFWGKETLPALVFSLYKTKSVITTDALDGKVVLGAVNIAPNTSILTADYHTEGWSEAFVLGDAEINLQQNPKGKKEGVLVVSSAWMNMSVIVEENIEPNKCDMIRARLNK